MNTSSLTSKPETANKAELYSRRFFSDNVAGSLSSARVLLGAVFDIYRPVSIVDVGCGAGAWLKAAEELGALELTGLDGEWVNPSNLASARIAFYPTNLEGPFKLGRKYDLCLSMEVAEHLAPSAATQFIDNLCAASDVVLFSAAIEHQGGVMHLNEQPQSYWAARFSSNGFEHHDLFRPLFWHDKRVDPWYRQNALLYVNSSNPLAALLRDRTHPSIPLDLVHPEIFCGNLETYKRPTEEPTLRYCWQTFKRWQKRQLRALLTR